MNSKISSDAADEIQDRISAMAPAQPPARAMPPTFLVGSVRSGTTLLRLMLGSHPLLCDVGEFEFAVKYASDAGIFPNVSDFSQQLRCDRVFRKLQLEANSDTDYVSMVRAFLTQAHARSHKPGVLATIHTRFDLIPKIWPEARILHLCRDPRDVARSCIDMGWVGNVWYGAEVWMLAEKRWETLTSSVGVERQVEITYEDLVTDTVTVLKAICNFLEIPYSEDMLTYPERSSYGPPDKSLVQQWTRKLAPRSIELVESRCGDLLRKRGYELVSGGTPPNLAEKTRLYLENRLYRLRRRLKRFGPALYLQWRLAESLGGRNSRWYAAVRKQLNAIIESGLR